jgi:hypothetical protein
MAVAVAKVVGEFQQCTPPEGLPACHTFEYLLVGGVIGLVLLPGVAVWRLRRGARQGGGENGGNGGNEARGTRNSQRS